MFAKRNQHRALGAEWLEHRQPLAGDVAVSLFGNQLVIEGDAAANAIEISPAQGGGFNISGSGEGEAATSINGNNQPFHVSARNATNILVDLGAGDDSLVISNGTQAAAGSSQGASHLLANRHQLRLSGDVTILGGAGNDQITVEGARMGSLLIIADSLSAEGGADSVRLSNIRTSGDVTVSTRAGDDQVTIADAVRVGGDLNVDSGDGTDAFTMMASRFQVRGDVNIDQPAPSVAASTMTTSQATDAGAAAFMPETSVNDAASSPVNQIATIDPVGASNPNMMSSAVTSGIPLTSDQTMVVDQMVGLNGMTTNDAVNAATSQDAISAIDNGSLPADVISQGFVPSAGSSLPVSTNPVLSPSLTTDQTSSAVQSALLQRAATAPTVSSFVNPAAADSLFTGLDEASLVGSAARNPTFLSSFSQPDPLNNVLDPQAAANPFSGF